MRERGIDVRAVQVVDGSMGQASLLHEGDGGRNREQGQRQRRRMASPAEAVAAIEVTQGYDLYSVDALTDNAGVEINA
jgi:hypothetical protein